MLYVPYSHSGGNGYATFSEGGVPRLKKDIQAIIDAIEATPNDRGEGPPKGVVPLNFIMLAE